MCSFIIWNISKALEKNPRLDLRHAMHSAHERLERESREGSGMISQPPDRRYLTCALLAWQQLGHKDADSLYQFVEENRAKLVCKDSKNSNLEKIDTINKAGVSSKPIEYVASHEKNFSKDTADLSSFDTISLMGPVVKLPVETKIVMHVEHSHDCSHHNAKKTQKPTSAPVPKPQNDTMNKIDAACCLDTACLQRLTELDTAVNELRSRAAKLARREAERVELLERAEAAWKDLELGYQRRLNLAQEKEDDIANQIKKTIEERNNYKNACTSLIDILKEHGDIAEKERARLTTMEKELCERACMRLQLSEESARHDAALAEQLCRTTQLDRDLLFKEEQAQRRVWSIQNNIESARCLTYEAERAMRAELAALKDQIKQVSEQLYVEETENKNIKSELEELRQEKADIIEDLDGCKLTCDSRMQAKIEELKQKRAQVMELKEKVIECKCKLPQDAAVHVKRTPSLAALCQCSPEDKLLDSCSCTSLRSQLLSNLLAGLFGGLQSELSGSGLIMPCQLLKCLEDKHNWDRSSVIKTNLLNFFAQLLVGELDIAIATSIENYHAKWVGKSCADQVRTISDYDETDEGWQERAIERRAQKLASKLAEQLYNERAEQLTKKAKDIVSKGPPPCQCKNQPAAFPCIVKTPHPISNTRKTNDIAPSYFKRTMQDVTQLRLQIEDLKKDSVKKEDLWHMEDKITKIVQRAAKPDNIASSSKNNKCTRDVDEQKDKESDCNKCYEPENTIKKRNPQKESVCFNRQFSYMGRNPGKIFKKREQSFAVNLCLCETDKKSNKLTHDHRQKSLKAWKSKKSGDQLKNTSFGKQSKPMKFSTSKGYNMSPINRYPSHPLCPSECVCFHKLPSNTSIDNLLNNLLKWRGDLMNYSKDHTKEQESDYNKIPLNSTNPKNEGITNDIEVNNSESTKNTAKFPMFSVIAYSSSNKMRDKSTDYVNTLPPTTESEYIGEIDLDKSNDNTCKCKAKQYVNSINHGDGNDMSSDDLYTCHNTDICRCVKTPEINYTSKQNIPENEKSALQNESQIYSVELQKPQFQDFECKKNKQDVHDSFISDVVKKSQIFSSGDYDVKFLGVTLTNTNEVFNTKNDYKHNLISVKSNNVLEECNENYYTKFPVKSNTSVLSQCNVNVYNNRELLQHIKKDHFEQNMLVNTISDVKEYEESKCICCDKNNTMVEVSNDLEVNAFNLLEEHLKGKLDELQRKCELICIPRQEKRELFTSILQKVKQVISESTNPLSCSCTGLCGNEKRWSRAYGLLLEYLKVKIKRVQCSCDANDENENPVLPTVLEKICKLIENDFQRLKEKYKHDNFKQTYLDQQTSPIHQAYTEMFVQVKDSEDCIKEAKSIGDISCQVSCHVSADNKSCEVMYNDFKISNTAEKNVSCELRNVNVTDCACRNTINMSHQFEKEMFVNVCTEPVSNKYDTTTLISKNITDDLSKSPKLESSMLLKESVVELQSNFGENKPEYPYFGYTLNCSCDHALGKCHCIKSMINTNYEKVDLMLKSLTNERFPKKLSYIMSKAPNKVKSEPIYINERDNNSSSDKLKQDMKCCDKESSTYTYENIVLKKSEENCGIMYDKANTIDDNSIDANINSEDCSHWHDCSEKQFNNNENYHTDTEYDKHLLYDSLYLPTDKCIKYKNGEHSTYSDTNLETVFENCNCKMVPVCHVKMLIEDIEKKIIESKCTCDALALRICPVHSEF